jgi:hypothetical protein
MELFGESSIYHLVAWVGTGLAVLFLILMLVGLDDALDGYFVQRIAVAFACGFGWTGVILTKEGWSFSSTLGLSIFVGSIIGGGLLGSVILLKKIADTPSDTLDSLVGKTGEVLASAQGDNELKISVMFQGRLQEMMAMTKTKGFLASGSAVKIEEVLSTGRLIVSPLE